MHVVSLVFEMGIVAVTLASLLSSMRHPDRDPTDKEPKTEVVGTVVSLVSTLATFSLTMIGAGDAVQGLKAISLRIKGQHITAEGRRFSAAGHNISESSSWVVRKLSSSGHYACLKLATDKDSGQLLLSPSDAVCVDDMQRAKSSSGHYGADCDPKARDV